jgi:hypothetical protein
LGVQLQAPVDGGSEAKRLGLVFQQALPQYPVAGKWLSLPPPPSYNDGYGAMLAEQRLANSEIRTRLKGR